MELKDKVRIDTVYTRSINLERDKDSVSLVKSYIPTSRSLLTLKQIVNTFGEQNIPRSWALVGPYGSGKSSFAVYLSHLLDNPERAATKVAIDVCREADEFLGEVIEDNTFGKKGYLSVLLTGTPDSLHSRFIASLYDAVVQYWNGIVGRKPAVLKVLEGAVSNPDLTTHDVVQLVKDVRKAVEQNGGCGLLIIIDELGKFLEYEARHYEANDIYLLQALAELAVKGGESNIYVFTLMHQGFEQYSRGLGEDVRNEWTKVQGRFENVPFLESVEQTLKVASKAINVEFSDLERETVVRNTGRIAKQLAIDGSLPGSLDKKSATRLFTDCYPLHPVTAVILPILCQKMAQNERTLFSYLGSSEKYGLKDSLLYLNDLNSYVMPCDVFDYFILNQPAVLTDPTTHRRWAEVITAIERLGDAPVGQIKLLKTIGLLNIIGAYGGFKASKSVIDLCSETPTAAEVITKELIAKSVVQYRKFSQEYRVWQGSDFDLDEAVASEIEKLGRFDLTEVLNERKPLEPIVARRHTIKTGSLRYFTPYFVSSSTYKQLKPAENEQRLILFLAESKSEFDASLQKVSNYFEDGDVVAFYPSGTVVRSVVAEVLALQRVERNRPELQGDPVAQREFKDRFVSASKAEEDLLHSLIEKPGEIRWFIGKEERKIGSKRELQKELSSLLDTIFKYSPKIFNELINRNKPSAQASGARNKLVAAMVSDIEKPDLGIEKFPAEKSIYKAFFQATKLHRKGEDGKWHLVPPEYGDEYNFYPVWEKIEEFLEQTDETPKSFAELNNDLRKSPYGLKAGILPLLYLTVFLANQDNLAFYEQDVYTPYITDYHIERFMKRPEYFQVQRIKMQGLRASVFQQYISVLYGESNLENKTLLSVAKPLAKFIDELPEFTKQTNRISDRSKRVLKAFRMAKSPIDLLFVKLPVACGYPAIKSESSEQEKIVGFTGSLVEVIRELRDCYATMLKDLHKVMADTLLPDLQISEIGMLRKKASARYEDLLSHTADKKGLRPFIEQLSDSASDDDLWSNRILWLLVGRIPEKWTDVDRDGAIKKLEEYARKLIDLRVLQDQYLKVQNKLGDGYEIIRLRSTRYGQDDHDEIVQISRTTRSYLEQQKSQFEELLMSIDENSRLAMLADLVDDFLSKKKASIEISKGKLQDQSNRDKRSVA